MFLKVAKLLKKCFGWLLLYVVSKVFQMFLASCNTVRKALWYLLRHCYSMWLLKCSEESKVGERERERGRDRERSSSRDSNTGCP